MPDHWTPRAEMLACDLREPGFAAAGIASAAWSARVEPDATRSLVRAALILTSGDATSACTARSEPCPDDWTLIAAVSDLETTLTDFLAAAGREGAACRTAMESQQPDTPAGRIIISDCETALEILAEATGALDAAIACLRQVPAEMGEVYEVPYQFLRAGRVLPHHGDFLTGTTT